MIRAPFKRPILAVCTTSYNCAQYLDQHFRSVFEALQGIEFEYVVVDNKSKDGTLEALRDLANKYPQIICDSRRCSRGAGRQVAASLSQAGTILAVDVDTVYSPILRAFVDAYFDSFAQGGLALQAIYAGLYPRGLWFGVGGMRDLNFGEDLDLWMRIWQHDRMRWYALPLGTNMKDAAHRDWQDFRSDRYGKWEKVTRLLRRELDLWKLRKYREMDLEAIRLARSVDLHLGPQVPRWFQDREPWNLSAVARRVRADLHALLQNGA